MRPHPPTGATARLLGVVLIGALFLHGTAAAQDHVAAPEFRRGGFVAQHRREKRIPEGPEGAGRAGGLLDLLLHQLHARFSGFARDGGEVQGSAGGGDRRALGEFDEEKDVDHIRQAILRHNIDHPVAVDSQYKIWNAYGVPGWPTLVLIGQGEASSIAKGVLWKWSGKFFPDTRSDR